MEIFNDLARHKESDQRARYKYDYKRHVDSIPTLEDGSRIVGEAERLHTYSVPDIRQYKPTAGRVIAEIIDGGIRKSTKLALTDTNWQDLQVVRITRMADKYRADDKPYTDLFTVGAYVLAPRKFAGFKFTDEMTGGGYLNIDIKCLFALVCEPSEFGISDKEKIIQL
jgi:hypothetical protein